MAPGTQPVSSDFSIPFALSHNRQSFRFFELPDELVDLVASGTSPRLFLKSANESTSACATQQLTPNTKSSEYVHLCSEDLENSWSIRQVSTSNEVYVVQALPRTQHTTNGDIEMLEAGQTPVVLTTIAKTDSMLELLPAKVDIEFHLRKLLPTWNHNQLTTLFEKSDASTWLGEENQGGFAKIASQIPAPDSSIRKTWRQLCVSRCPRDSTSLQERYFIPTTQLLESAWKSVHAAYSIRAISDSLMEKVDFEDAGEGMDELVPVKAALWARLSLADNSLERDETLTFVIRTHWQSMWTSPQGTKTEDRFELEELWRDLLPRQWSSDAVIEKLEAETYELYSEGGRGMIRWKARSSSSPAAPTTTAKPGKRKWHEKFRDNRNVKP